MTVGSAALPVIRAGRWATWWATSGRAYRAQKGGPTLFPLCVAGPGARPQVPRRDVTAFLRSQALAVRGNLDPLSDVAVSRVLACLARDSREGCGLAGDAAIG